LGYPKEIYSNSPDEGPGIINSVSIPAMNLEINIPDLLQWKTNITLVCLDFHFSFNQNEGR
jgi:hypothetical protein